MRWTARPRGRARGLLSGEEGGRKGWRGEGEEIEGYKEEFVEGADCEKYVLVVHKNQHATSRAIVPCAGEVDPYLVRIV